MTIAGASIRFLEATPDGRGYLVEIDGGPHHGDLVFVPGPPPAHLLGATPSVDRYVPPPRRYDDLTPTERREAQTTAERLLLALLDEGQAADYRATGGFWVELADGRLRLGTLYHLIWQPRSGHLGERILCVVPEGHDEGLTPPADIWTNLLLSVHADPTRFFAVANVLRSTRRPPPGALPSFGSVGTEALATMARHHYRTGDWWSGALVEHALAGRLAARGRRRTALKCAVPGAFTALAVDAPPGTDADDVRRRLLGTCASLVPRTGGRPGVPEIVDDLIALADRRLRSRRPDLSDVLDDAALGVRRSLAS